MTQKRIRLAVVLGFAVACGALALHRRTLPRAPDHTRFSADNVPGPVISVCWIETGRFGPSTASGLLIRHPKGDLLLDTGNSLHFSKELEGFSWTRRLWLEALPGMLKPEAPLPVLLQAAHADAAHLKAVLLSHAHVDHAGGLLDLPPVPVWIPQEEIAFAARERDAKTLAVIPAHADLIARQAVPVPFQSKPYENFDESWDVFGDGMVVLVKLFGHTPGSMGTFVQLPQSHRRLFHVGDAVDDVAGFEDRLEKPAYLRISDNDREQANGVVGTLAQLHTFAPQLLIIPAHDRGAWRKVFGDVPGCVQ